VPVLTRKAYLGVPAPHLTSYVCSALTACGLLQTPQVGEHDSCGPGNLKKSGFSYDPESFMSARVGFYNFSWRDMGVPDLDRMMDIVQVRVAGCPP
jgi:hypothetical protein